MINPEKNPAESKLSTTPDTSSRRPRPPEIYKHAGEHPAVAFEVRITTWGPDFFCTVLEGARALFAAGPFGSEESARARAREWVALELGSRLAAASARGI